VLGCGTTDWRKGPDLLSRSRHNYASPHSIGPIPLVGGQTNASERRDLEQLVESYGLNDIVTFVGRLRRPSLHDCIGRLLLSSREIHSPWSA